MLSILYGITSSLAWGAGDFAGGLAARKIGAYKAVFYADLLGLIAIFLIVFINGEKIPPSYSIWISALAGVLGSLGLLILYYSMAHGQMSVAAPVSALIAAALPVLVGVITEGLPTFTQLLGFGLALAAVWLVSQSDLSQRFHIDRLSDLRLPLLAGVGFGSYFVLMHFATEGLETTYWPMIFSRTAGTLLLLGIVLSRRESFSVPRDAWAIVLVNGVLDVGGNLFYILALQTGRLDISAVLSSLYPGATVILAWLILKEQLSRTQWLGIGAALLAIVLFTV